ncbi:hypothetical protein MO767_10495 [Pseudomonas sp. UYIF39]|uniref:hypothetical protein n=1 Tax=Pseudomonas sp. UYIF39 TaxID=1630747 RepID=UPI00249E5362|nr:hypothetical protein [Pseudomonas sp. UYIF39]MDI3354786.1 hypothetical protein [Pseudomonas sp. UYIF39]
MTRDINCGHLVSVLFGWQIGEDESGFRRRFGASGRACRCVERHCGENDRLQGIIIKRIFIVVVAFFMTVSKAWPYRVL